MPHESTLPLELCGLITDELCDDNLALKECLSVSRGFRHYSRRHLFKDITIEDAGTLREFHEPRTPDHAQRRLDLLASLMRPPSLSKGNDGILSYIRHVHFQFSNDGLYATFDRAYCGLYPESARCVVDILQMLRECDLRSIEIYGSGYLDIASWSVLLPPIRGILLDLCRLASSTISLGSITDAPRNILRGTKVTHFSLEGVELLEPDILQVFPPEIFPEYDEESDLASLPLPNLQSAEVGNFLDEFCNKIYPATAGTPHLSLNALELVVDPFDGFLTTSDWISRNYSNLEMLKLQFFGDCSRFEFGELDLRSLTRLKDIWISFEDSDPDVTCSSTLPRLLPSLLSFFLNSCPNNTLTAITLELPKLVLEVNPDGSFDIDLNLFTDLDKSFNSSSDFPSLQDVMIRSQLRVPFYQVEQCDSREMEVLDLISKSFPSLAGSNDFKLNMSVGVDFLPIYSWTA